MDAIVLDLQKEAYDSKSDVVALLRKAYVVARKLKLKEFGDWINEELNGYQSYEKTPDYRNVCGQLKARNIYYGLVPVLIDNSELADIFTNRKLIHPIS
ncbi:AbiTii domain-containing protein, partial [Bacillus mobilis]